MRTVVISTNDNDEYLFFVPLITYAWNKIGWNVFCFCIDGHEKKYNLVEKHVHEYCYCKDNNILYYPNFSLTKLDHKYKAETIVQCLRLFAYNTSDLIDQQELLMISDVDMLPLSNYWNPSYGKITCYGKDLSDTHYPMCYVAAESRKWKEIMDGEENFLDIDMEQVLKKFPQALSSKKEDWWQVDQDILTAKLKLYEDNITYINRGQSPYSDYPIGRIDRSAWSASHRETQRIDCHMLRPGYTDENWPRIMKLIQEQFNPTFNEIEWLENYRNEYLKLL